jgi:hypothetical protein
MSFGAVLNFQGDLWNSEIPFEFLWNTYGLEWPNTNTGASHCDIVDLRLLWRDLDHTYTWKKLMCVSLEIMKTFQQDRRRKLRCISI